MKTLLILVLFLITCLPITVPAQGSGRTSLTVNIDTTNHANPDICKVYECWARYLASNPDSLYDNPYWNEADKKRYKSYDLLKSEGWLSPGLYGFRRLNKQVISITSLGDSYVIRSIFYSPGTETRDLFIMAITNTIAKKDESGNFKLHNWLHYYARSWLTKRVGIIDYCYYPSYPFNDFEAEKANKLITFFKEKFDIKVDHVAYYIAENCDDIMRLKGFDYVIGMGDMPNNLCGFCDTYNHIIYSNSKKGENYEHELTHLINNFYPRAHGLFLNGLADYFIADDLKLGLPLTEHFRRVDHYLDEHPEINLNNLNSFYQMDNITSPSYLLGMIICQLTLEKGGLALLKKGMNYGSSLEDLYRFMDHELGIKRENLNNYFRKLIRKYANEGMNKIVI